VSRITLAAKALIDFLRRDLADSLERQAFLINVLAVERLLKIGDSRRTRKGGASMPQK